MKTLVNKMKVTVDRLELVSCFTVVSRRSQEGCNESVLLGLAPRGAAAASSCENRLS